MLMLTRKPGEEIRLTIKGKSVDGADSKPDLEILIVITEVRGKQVGIGIDAPPDKVRIMRGELVPQSPQVC